MKGITLKKLIWIWLCLITLALLFTYLGADIIREMVGTRKYFDDGTSILTLPYKNPERKYQQMTLIIAVLSWVIGLILIRRTK